MTEIELRERDVNKFTALGRADCLVQYLPWFTLMSGQHRHAAPEAAMLRAWILALSPKTATSSGWVGAGLAAPLSSLGTWRRFA
jgi:hypothetical protein